MNSLRTIWHTTWRTVAVLVAIVLFLSFIPRIFIENSENPSLASEIFAVAIVPFVLVVAFVIRRIFTRQCPRCGRRVRNGALDCFRCGFDFRTIGASALGESAQLARKLGLPSDDPMVLKDIEKLRADAALRRRLP